MTSSRILKLVTAAAVVVFLASAIAWVVGLDSLAWGPGRFATGEEGGLYSDVGKEIADSLRNRFSIDLPTEHTKGSAENLAFLSDEKKGVTLAVVQGGAPDIADHFVVTPLFREYLFVICRASLTAKRVADLHQSRVAIGAVGSGTNRAAERLLNHFDLGDVDRLPVGFLQMERDETIDAAILVAGLQHKHLKRLLETGKYRLLPVRTAPALEMKHAFYKAETIPAEYFSSMPPVPAQAVPTIAATAFLVANDRAADRVVAAALAAVHEGSLRLKVPTLIPRAEADSWIATTPHPIARRYFNPADNLGYVTTVMESLVATKELIFALCAGAYVLWLRWRRLREREAQAEFTLQKEKIDRLLQKTLQLEERHLHAESIDDLRDVLMQVTRIKLDAMREFTEEELRGDQTFSIFLDQCAHLAAAIDRKIQTLSSQRET